VSKRIIGLLDTSVLLELDEDLEPSIRHFVSSTICRAEMALGRQLRENRGDEKEAKILATLIKNYDRADIWRQFDTKASDAYGYLAAQVLPKAPATARSRDALIAAHAASLGLPVVTANTKDFQKLGVPVLTQTQAKALLKAN